MRTFNSDSILKGYKENNNIEDEFYFELRIAAALNDLVDIEKSKTVAFLSEEDYMIYYNELSESERCIENVFVSYGVGNMMKVYDVEEITLFDKKYLKLYCYDLTEVHL